ncbi:MAG: DNA repair protein RecO [Patescibacteria group bacterium]|jgi:DNA repair protein RecO (recombination protein O)
MRNVTTLGIVLKRTNLDETDKILTIYSQELGKVSAIAKGIKKITSRKAGHLEPGNVVQFELAKGKTFYIITNAKITHSFAYADLDKMKKLFLWCEILDKLAHDSEKNTDLFDLAVRGLSHIAAENDLIKAELELYSTTGYQLEIRQCILGQEVLKQDQNYFSITGGGVVCADHMAKYPDCVPISVEAIKFLRLIQNRDYETLARVKVGVEIGEELERIAILQRHHVIERKINSEG